MENYSDKVVVVTGACSGIGAEICKQFSTAGAQVVGIDISDKGSDNTTAHYQCNVTQLDAVNGTIDQIISKFKKIDVLVNSAGIVALDSAETLSEDDWRNTIDINLTGSFFMCQAVGRTMLKHKSGKIVNIASTAGTVGIDQHVAYCASKFGIIGMTKVLAIEWAQHNINVNSVSPTVVLTPLGKKAWAGDVGEALKKTLPARRFVEPWEVANTVLFLASDKASMLHGSDVLVDGGYTAH